MSIFGSLLKVVGSVAKGVVSRVTGGVSDQVLAAFKKRGEAKKMAQAQQYSLQQLALANKLKPLQPSVKSTESVLDQASRQMPSVANEPGYNDPYGRKRMPNGYRRAAERLAPGGMAVSSPPKRKRKRKAAPNPVDQEHPDRNIVNMRLLRQVEASRSPAKPRTGGKRAMPKGALDLARIGQMYQAAGKPMPWQAFIKANSNVRIA